MLEMNLFALPIVKMLLLAIIFLAVMVEIKTAGLGLGALMGAVAAAIFFAGQYADGLVSLYDIALFLGGLLFIAIEILTPGIGIFALLGVGAVLASFAMALGGDEYAAYILLGAAVVAAVLFVILLKRLPNSRLWSRMVLKASEKSEQGYVSARDYSPFIGRTGVVVTELRPSGTAVFGKEKLDIVSEGSYIEKGAIVEVVAAHGSRIVVRKFGGDNK